MRREFSVDDGSPETTDSFVGVFWIVVSLLKRLQRRFFKYLLKKSLENMGWGLKLMLGEWLMCHNTGLMVAHVVMTWSLIVYRAYKRHAIPYSTIRGIIGAGGDCEPREPCSARLSDGETTTHLSTTDLSFMSYKDELDSSKTDCRNSKWWQEVKAVCHCAEVEFSSSELSSSTVVESTSTNDRLASSSSKSIALSMSEGTPIPAKSVSSTNILNELHEAATEGLSIEELIELQKQNMDYSKMNNFDDEEDEEEFWRNTKEYSTHRQSVYAEIYDPEEAEEWKPPVYPKNDEQRTRLALAVKDILLFRELDSIQLRQILDAMFPKKVTRGEIIINEGDDGDFFYVIDSGTFEAYVKEDNGKERLVKTYAGSGSFGELALLYNMPRAATVRAASDGVLWVLDRLTFRSVILQASYNKREIYKQLIAKVPMFETLKPHERLMIADALVMKTYANGSKIISQGDEANGMYFIIEGHVRITVSDEMDNDIQLKVLGPGDYFGELALITHRPRAASAYAAGFVRLAFLDTGGFERLLGSCIHIMERHLDKYEEEQMKSKKKFVKTK